MYIQQKTQQKKFQRKNIGLYGIGGLMGASIDLLVLYVMTEYVGLYYILSQAVAFSISVSSSFFFQKYITFAHRSGYFKKQFLYFVLFQGVGNVVGLVLLYIFVEYSGLYYMVASILCKMIIFVRNYVMNSIYSFQES